MSSFAARKARDSMSKAIYTRLFALAVTLINRQDDFNSELSTIMLDIAGFGKNTQESLRKGINISIYSQFCQYFSNRMLRYK